LLLPHFVKAQDKLQFISEMIDFEINNTQFLTNGIFVFANNSNREIKQMMIFPFSQDTDSIKIKRVFNLSYNQSIRYQLIDKGIAFKIVFLPNDTVKINISYSQARQHENIYLLNSTLTWGKALQTARYSLTFDESVIIDSISYKPDKIEGNIYYWNKKNFYPEDDFKIMIK